MKTVYQKFESSFANVSAYVILKDGVHIANISLKYPKDGMGRLQCYIHIFGTEMQNDFVSGCGYDKRSHAIHKTAKKYLSLVENEGLTDALSVHEKLFLALLSSNEADNGWDGVLYKHGFTKINVM